MNIIRMGLFAFNLVENELHTSNQWHHQIETKLVSSYSSDILLQLLFQSRKQKYTRLQTVQSVQCEMYMIAN